jgi:hypothetical protein
MCVAISLFTAFSFAWCTAGAYGADSGLLGGNPENDLGDAPDSSNGSGGLPLQAYPDGTMARYPTVYGSGLPPYGPIHWKPREVAYLGHSVTLESEADDGADEDSINNIQPLEETSNRDGGDDGVRLPLVLPNYGSAVLEYTVAVVNPAQGVMYVNVWFDWNRDGDWDDTLNCPNGARAPEWAVQNQAVALTGAGRLRLVTPSFVCWHPAGSDLAAIWMRITLSETPRPVAGQSSASGGSASKDGYLYGETEDYYLSPERQAGAADYNWLDKSSTSATGSDSKMRSVAQNSQTSQSASIWIQGLEDPVWKWSQWPDMTPDGIGIRVDNSDRQRRILADDFECVSRNCISGVRLWGVWKNDLKGRITKIRLRIYDDDPAGLAGSDGTNIFSKPYSDIRWQKEFGPGQFEETLYYVHAAGQWWSDPGLGQLAKPGSTGLWQITIDIGREEAFVQEGQPGSPRLYWLAVEMETAGGEFGWQTRQPPEHFMGAAVWDLQNSVPLMWQELRYPAGHPSALSRQSSIDLAFCLKYTDCVSTPTVPTVQPGSATQCPAVSTRCPTVTTQCPVVTTNCPTQSTQCPAASTRCPVVSTQCPTQSTQCPPESTKCPAALSRCPPVLTNCTGGTTRCTTLPGTITQCPVVATQCPVKETQCPERISYCPAPSPTRPCPVTVFPALTQCPTVQTKCPVVSTKCPEESTKCPVKETYCPVKETYCPAMMTRCSNGPMICTTTYPAVQTTCPRVATKCPAETTKCPEESTKCPPVSTQCPAETTKCPGKFTFCPPTTTICDRQHLTMFPAATLCPAVSTKCPAVTTQCPAESTKCPAKTTYCPAATTKCPEESTKCPVKTTYCPVIPTQCPRFEPVTVYPPVSTMCQTVATKCPEVSTKCPVVTTKCPPVTTLCPPVGTTCPGAVTKCPVSSTKCPEQSTKCPVVFTRCPRLEPIPVPQPLPQPLPRIQPIPARPLSQSQLSPATALPGAGTQSSLVVRASAPASTLLGQSASQTFLSDALSGGCPTVETRAAMVFATGG